MAEITVEKEHKETIEDPSNKYSVTYNDKTLEDDLNRLMNDLAEDFEDIDLTEGKPSVMILKAPYSSGLKYPEYKELEGLTVIELPCGWEVEDLR